MNEEITYNWSEELGRSALLAAHAAKQSRLWFMASAGVFLSVLGWSTYFTTRQAESLFAGVFGLIFILGPIRTYFVYRRFIKDTGRLLNDPKVTILLRDEDMTISSDQGTRKLEWSKITDLKDKDGFLLPYSGKLLLACLPKQFLSDSQVEFIISKSRT